MSAIQSRYERKQNNMTYNEEEKKYSIETNQVKIYDKINISEY